MQLNTKETLRDLAWILAGNITLAIGVAWFILPNNVLTGGGRFFHIRKEICNEDHFKYHLLSIILITVIIFSSALYTGRYFYYG